MKPGHWQAALIALLGGVLCGFISDSAFASPDYQGCAECHGGFNDNSYTSLHDGANWANGLMEGHKTFVGDECTACHKSGPRGEVYLNFSTDSSLSKSCVGCHGRDEDVTGSCTGLNGTLGGVEEQCGSGAGLRKAHEAVNDANCASCHGAPTPVGEHIAPFNYGQTGVIIQDPCDSDGTESRFGATGLDNDGDGLRDASDSNCQSAEPAPEFDSTPAAGATLAFGDQEELTESTDLMVQVDNLGDADLTLGCSITGTDSGSFNLKACPTPIAGAGSGNITVSCEPVSVGAKTATLEVATNDADEPNVSYNLTCTGTATPAPEFDSTPVAGATLAFGDQEELTESTDLMVQVDNLGDADLTLGCSITGTDSGSFNLKACPTPIAGAGSGNITVSCEPVSVGAKTATLEVATNDADESNVSYNLTCTGTATPAPEFDSTPVAGATLAFGDQEELTESTDLMVQVDNLGDADLTLGCSITGTDSGSFNLKACPTPIAGAGSGNITVSCEPVSVGAKTATLEVTTNDSDEAFVTYNLTCTGTPVPAPEFDSTPAAGATLAFGDQEELTESTDLMVQVDNLGDADLTLGCSITGTDSGSFNLKACPTPIAGAGSGNITVSCEPVSVGAKTATLEVATNDADEPNVSYNLTCTGTAIPAPEFDSTPAAGATLAFGDQEELTESTDLMVQVDNLGDADLTLGCSITGTDSGSFNLKACPTPIAGAGSGNITVSCEPVSVGAKTATLEVATNDADEPNVSYSLTCTGIEQSPSDILFSDGFEE